MRNLHSRLLAILLPGMLLAGTAQAHRGHDNLSVVEIDAAGKVRVTHYLAAHDVEPALTRIAPDAQPSLDDPDAVAALTRYVGTRFGLATAAGVVPLALETTDLAGDDVRLVYVGTLHQPAAALDVSDVLFVDVYPAIENQVNVRRGGVTRTLLFGEGDADTQRVEAEAPRSPATAGHGRAPGRRKD